MAKLEVNLHLHLLGTFQVMSNGEPLAGFRSNKVRALLTYLVLSGERPSARDTLANLLWGEFEERAAKVNLRQSLSNLRQLLPAEFLTITPQAVTFHAQKPAVWVDVLIFQQLVADSQAHDHATLATCPACLARLVKAAALYQGELLAGFHLDNVPAFAEWRLPQQEALHQTALWVLMALVESYGRLGQPTDQIAALRQLITLEPWHEVAHRQLIELLAQQGQRSQALAQYETCRRILAAELGVEPGAETTALVQLIKSDRLPQPASAAETAPAHNLPAATTTFIGREAQLTALQEHLTNSETRLVTIVGLAGIGKTRLAQAAASHVLAAFPQGVWFVPLAALEQDEEEMAEKLATAVLTQLNLPLPAGQAPFTTLTDFLHAKKLLLVLDNLEHLLPAVTAVVVDLLQQAPQLTIWATSQVRLDCQAETVLRLEGLALPAAAAEPRTAESVQLFVERARRHDPGFAPAGDDWAQIAALCRLCEGLPLAIELAASLVVHFPLADMVNTLAQNLNLLMTTSLDLPARHRTMGAALHYAWQLLSETEQQVMRQLSLFPGEFGRGAALAVTDATLTDLMALVNRSWLRPAAPGRYVLHGLIAQFARDALSEKPETEAITRARYGRYYLTFLQQQMTHYDTPNEAQALIAIRREIDNIRQLWRWLVANEDWEGLSSVLSGLMNFYNDLGRQREGLLLVAESLNKMPGVEGKQAEIKARLHCWQALFWLRDGRYAEAETQLGQLLFTFQNNRDFSYLALVLVSLGRLALRVGNFEAGHDWSQQALARYEALGDERGIGRALNQLARYYELVGSFDQARACYADCLEMNQRWGVPQATAVTLNNLGLLLHRVGDYEEAKTLLEESVAIYEAMGNEFALASGWSNLALVLIELEAYDEAQSLLEQARQIQERLGYRPRLAIVLNNLGFVAHLKGDYTEAEATLKESIRLKRSLGNEQGLTYSLVHLGHTYLGLEQYAEARTCFKEALQLTQQLTLPPVALVALLGLAQLKAAAGNLVEAIQLLQLPLHHSASWQRTRREAQALQAELGQGLAEDQLETAVATGRALTLEAVTSQLLTE